MCVGGDIQGPGEGKEWPEVRTNQAEAGKGQGGVAPGVGDTEERGGGVLPTGGMCHLSEWPKSFLKAVIQHYSHHQVRPEPRLLSPWTPSGSTAVTGRMAVMCVHPLGEARPATSGCAEVLQRPHVGLHGCDVLG